MCGTSEQDSTNSFSNTPQTPSFHHLLQTPLCRAPHTVETNLHSTYEVSRKYHDTQQQSQVYLGYESPNGGRRSVETPVSSDWTSQVPIIMRTPCNDQRNAHIFGNEFSQKKAPVLTGLHNLSPVPQNMMDMDQVNAQTGQSMKSSLRSKSPQPCAANSPSVAIPHLQNSEPDSVDGIERPNALELFATFKVGRSPSPEPSRDNPSKGDPLRDTPDYSDLPSSVLKGLPESQESDVFFPDTQHTMEMFSQAPEMPSSPDDNKLKDQGT